MPNPNSLLDYEFSIPYDNSGKLTINNHGANPIVIEMIKFDSNAEISGAPWGSLSPWNAELTHQASTQTHTYTIRVPHPGITIPANGSADLAYSVSNTLGILPIAMDPNTVTITLSNHQDIKLPIKNACPQCPDPTPGKRHIGYYTDWDQYARRFNAADIPTNQMNGILYAFIGFDAHGEVSLLDRNSDNKQLVEISMLRKRYPYLHTSLSFGGWTLSEPFSALAANPIARQRFIQNTIAAIRQSNFDGIDIDWEYPTKQPQDATNFATLLSEFRAALDEAGHQDQTKYSLSIAAPAGIDTIQAIQNHDPHTWQTVAQAVDHLNLMSYDFHGAWDTKTNHQSALYPAPQDPNSQDLIKNKYNIDSAVTIYEELGFPSSKIVVGIPAYVRTSTVASATNNGLYQTITGTPPGQFDDTGVYDYRCAINRDCQSGTELPTDTQMLYDETAKTAYWFSNSTKIFGTGDNAKSVTEKAKYVKEKGLGGIMFWTTSGAEVNNPNASLVTAAYNVLKAGDEDTMPPIQTIDDDNNDDETNNSDTPSTQILQTVDHPNVNPPAVLASPPQLLINTNSSSANASVAASTLLMSPVAMGLLGALGIIGMIALIYILYRNVRPLRNNTTASLSENYQQVGMFRNTDTEMTEVTTQENDEESGEKQNRNNTLQPK